MVRKGKTIKRNITNRRKKAAKPDTTLYKIERVKTGIPGLDKLIQGGFVKGSGVLVCGEPGTGKSIFCLQFLWEGLQKGEPGVYITLEETADEIKKDALVFGWDFSTYEKKDKFRIIERNVFEDPNIEFFEIDKLKAKRVVIDSISLLSLVIEDKASLRNRVRELITSLKTRGITTLLTSESIDGLSRLGVEEFLADGVIDLEFTPIGTQAGRSLFIKKLRRTKQSEDIHPIEIGNTGIKILSV